MRETLRRAGGVGWVGVEVNQSTARPRYHAVNEPPGRHSEQVRCTVHSMLWHADIQNITVDVTFRRKATGFGITSSKQNKRMKKKNKKSNK